MSEIISNHLTALDVDFKPYSKGYICTCPLAPWTHSKGTDRHKSFVIWPEIDRFQCYACGVKGDLHQLFSLLHKHRNDAVTAAIMAGWDESIYKLKLKLNRPQRRRNKREYLDEDILDTFPAYKGTPAETYLIQRGLDKSADLFDLRYDTVSDRVVFPVRDKKGLLGIVGRTIDPNNPHKHFKYWTASGDVWGGEDKLSNNRKVLIVEGFTDLLRVYHWANELGYDTICSWTCNISYRQIDLLASFGHIPYCGYDQDEAGEKGYSELERLYPSKLLFRLNWSYANSRGQIKDMGELDHKELKEILE